MNVSERLWVAIKTARRPAYKIAQQAGVHPSWLSKAINGIETVRPSDPRIIAIGRIVGVPAGECFDEIATDSADGRVEIDDKKSPPKRART